MSHQQVWEASIVPPGPLGDVERDGQIVKEPDPPGRKQAVITLHDHPVRHRKAGKPDAHARRIRQVGDARIEETYLNRFYRVEAVTGTYAGTKGRVRFVNEQGTKEARLTAAGPFTLDGLPLDLRRGFTVSLEHLGDDYVAGVVTVTFRQLEEEVV